MGISLVTIGWIIGSISSSTAIIMMNKYVMRNYHFNSPTFLTAYHFLMTWVVLELMCCMKLFERATTFPMYDRCVLAVLTVAGVVFMNFNLKTNSVGFYQLSKLLCIPAIVAYNFLFEDKSTPILTLGSLFVLLVGISLFTINDIEVRLLGAIIAAIAVIFVAIAQTKMGSVQKSFAISGPTAQHASALIQFVITVVSACLLETHGPNSLIAHSFARIELVVVILSGFVSVSVNVCGFGLIGKTSPVTYQVVGHCKTILIFVFGLILFPADEGETRGQFVRKIIGLVISMAGVIAYTVLEMRAKRELVPEEQEADRDQLLVEEEITPSSPEPS
jgi:solute carrier family 35 protein E3